MLLVFHIHQATRCHINITQLKDTMLFHVYSQQESLSLREALYNLKKGDTRGFLQLTDQYIGLIMCAKYSDHPKEVAENLQEV